MRRALRLPVAILAILFSGILGVVLFRVAADAFAHSVLLKWEAPPPKPDSTVVSYNVYRSQLDGSYKAIASGVVAPKYVDHAVSSGITYHYFVKAVDAAGQESPPSNSATVKIP